MMLPLVSYSGVNTLVIAPNSPSDIYVVGEFNQWQFSESSQMRWHEQNKRYQFVLPSQVNKGLFNVYKDRDWQNPLATEYGKPFTCGFWFNQDSPDVIQPRFYGWAKDKTQMGKTPQTVTGELITLSKFAMKSLNRAGDLYIYLPPSYRQQPTAAYPVIYMLDGQNLFSEHLSYSFEWQVDETITANNLEVIVVGISNGPQRWSEYNPWHSVNYRGDKHQGQGEKTIKFIKSELKPYIDRHYRTLPDRNNTALIGSSLGGLMALYGVIEHSEVFGKVAALSPAFSFQSIAAQSTLNPAQSNLINAVQQMNSSLAETKIYFDVGEVEYGSYTLVDELYRAFLSSGVTPEQIKLVKDDLGRHCELDWARRLPTALLWLFNRDK